MNLAQIRTDIESAMEYAPGTAAWADRVSRVVNDVYRELIGQNHWRFRERVFEFPIRPDVSFTGDWTLNSDTVANVTVTGGSATEAWRHGWVQGPNGRAYRVTKYTTGLSDTIYLKDKYQGANAVGGAGTAFWWEYPMSRRFLGDGDLSATGLAFRDPDREVQELWPMAEVLGVVERNDDTDTDFLDQPAGVGQVRHLSLADEQGWNLNIQESPGEPRAVLIRPRSRMPFPYVPGEGEANNIVPFASLTGGGSLAADVEYRYFYTVRSGIDRSAPSPIMSATPTGATLTVRLNDLPTWANNNGDVKEIWRERAGDGVFRWLAEVDNTTSQFDDDGSYDVGERWEDEGPMTTVQLWPRTDKDRLIQIRYLAGNRSLLLDQDVPDMPAEYHQILVSRAVIRLVAEGGGTSLLKMHATIADEMEQKLRRRYLVNKSVRPQRELWGHRTVSRWGPTITWTG